MGPGGTGSSLVRLVLPSVFLLLLLQEGARALIEERGM